MQALTSNIGRWRVARRIRVARLLGVVGKAAERKLLVAVEIDVERQEREATRS